MTWLLDGYGEHTPFLFQHGLYYLCIHVVHPVLFFLNFLDHHSRFLFESEFLIEEYFPTEIHFSILIHPKLGEAIEREVPSFHKILNYSTKVDANLNQYALRPNKNIEILAQES